MAVGALAGRPDLIQILQAGAQLRRGVVDRGDALEFCGEKNPNIFYDDTKFKTILTNVNVGVRELPPHGGLLQVERVKLLVYVAQQVRLHQHLANDAKQPHEAHRGTNCKSKQAKKKKKTIFSFVLIGSTLLPGKGDVSQRMGLFLGFGRGG